MLVVSCFRFVKLFNVVNSILVSIDLGVVEFESLVGGVFLDKDNKRFESLDAFRSCVRSLLKTNDIDYDTILLEQQALSVVKSLRWHYVTHQVHGFNYTAVCLFHSFTNFVASALLGASMSSPTQHQRTSAAGRAAATARAAAAATASTGGVGVDVTDRTAYDAYTQHCYDSSSFDPLVADSFARAQSQVDNEQYWHRRHALATAAEAPFVVAKKLVQTLDLNMADYQIRAALVVIVGL